MHRHEHSLDFTAVPFYGRGMTHETALAVASGLGFGLSLIVAIGAQNAFVLRQGLLREHVLPVVVVCAASDAVLIVAGIAGLGSLLDLAPWLVDVMRVAGAAFLLTYAALAARRAWRPGAIDARADGSGSALWPVVSTAVALTWLNPHVYLDTVVLLGSVAGTHGDQRWWFGAGAVAASIVWFTALGFGARLLQPVFVKPSAWRVLDAVIAVVMVLIAATLLRDLIDA
jgi:L-lysine exporter family protein LysE/ArgO